MTVSPQFVSSFDLGTALSAFRSHEVIVRNNRMYVASKNNGNNTTNGWVSIYDVSNPANPNCFSRSGKPADAATPRHPSDDGNC